MQEDVLKAGTVAVLADCHIHPGGGPDWTAAVLKALVGCEAIVTLGDMGEVAGLDRLAAIAPVIGVRGADDQPDARAEPGARVLKLDGRRIGCVFDAKEAGFATSSDPFALAPDWGAAADRLFGGPVEALLHAGTHRPFAARVGEVLAVNPGSALLPAKGAHASFARLTVEPGGLRAEIVRV